MTAGECMSTILRGALAPRRLGLLFLLMTLVTGPANAETLVPGYWEQTPLPRTGLATYYALGLMENVQRYREAQAEISACPECVGAVALLRAGDIGRKVWLQPPSSDPVGPFLVVDCARQQDVEPLLARNWAVDVSYELGQLWGMTRPLTGVTILEDPADALPDNQLRVPTPFAVLSDRVVISAPTPTPQYQPAKPTPWPTRLPQLLPGGVRPGPGQAQATPIPLPTLGPAPLTPIVTTPTPVATLEGAGRTLLSTDTPEPSSISSAAQAADNVSLGHAGMALLDPVATPVRQLPGWPTASVTPRAPTRTPRPDLTPILPEGSATPDPALDEDLSFFERLWQSILEALTG